MAQRCSLLTPKIICFFFVTLETAHGVHLLDFSKILASLSFFEFVSESIPKKSERIFVKTILNYKKRE